MTQRAIISERTHWTAQRRTKITNYKFQSRVWSEKSTKSHFICVSSECVQSFVRHSSHFIHTAHCNLVDTYRDANRITLTRMCVSKTEIILAKYRTFQAHIVPNLNAPTTSISHIFRVQFQRAVTRCQKIWQCTPYSVIARTAADALHLHTVDKYSGGISTPAYSSIESRQCIQCAILRTNNNFNLRACVGTHDS